MGRYNLLDEKWIMVLREDTGQTEKVSLKEVFAHAGDYYDLAGEMKTQDFAILRVLLAVLQTVFSRFDSEGIPYDFIEINEETFQQLEPVDRDDLSDDEDPFFETWLSLWKKGEFPEVVQEYLEAWRDHFYLFDDKYPFYQVTPEEMEKLVKDEDRVKVKDKSDKGKIFGKYLNRTISESKHTSALFTPVAEGGKDNLRNDQLVRWLIMFQGYTGTADKSEVEGTEKNVTKGWLYNLGGIYLKGHNLFETLMLNCILSSDFDKQLDDEKMKIQIPSWERSPLENVGIYFRNQVDNRASLYTNWSRAISFMDDYREGEPFYCFPAKLPKIDCVENFMEPMTCWLWNKSGDNKGKFTPKIHERDEAVWRNFSVLMGVGREEGDYFRQPGILSWYHKVCENSSMRSLDHFKIIISSVSLQNTKDASNTPVDEIVDEIQMETAVLIDDNKDGWIELINTLVNNTKSRIDKTLIRLIGQIALIRINKDDDTQLLKKKKEYKERLEKQERERLYQEIDRSFREWLSGLKDTDSMNGRALEWYSILKEAILNRGNEIFRNATFRDLKGIQQKDKKILNIATAYNKFKWNIDNEFKS